MNLDSYIGKCKIVGEKYVFVDRVWNNIVTIVFYN